MAMTMPTPELMELVGRIMADLGVQRPPPYRPADGQSRDEWIDEVARVRAQHDQQARVLSVHVITDGPEVASVTDHRVAVDGDTIGARVYTPDGGGPFGVIVFYHGGAWWLAGGEEGFAITDDYCRTFCARLGMVVVNVDYRLAPECPFPTQLEDSYAGLKWVVQHAELLNIDPTDLVVMGASSGGNQAAALCLLARQRGGPEIRAQVLHVPALDLTGGSPSLHEQPGLWEGLVGVISLYADDEQLRDPLVSPLLADDLSRLPPAVIVTGDHDPLRDDGSRYAARLREAGVAAKLLEFPMLHNIALPETTQRMFDEMVEAIVEIRTAAGSAS